MKISALRLFNVKRFAGRGVAIEGMGDGVNVLCAANEFGKSTSFEALHALFFQPYSGTPGAVQALRPYSGGNPLVEADIETAAGRFRITKQYYGGRSARVVDCDSRRLVAQADEAEQFIASLVHGGTAGPAGLLWVRQGITGMERRSKSEEDTEKQARAGLLESVQGEIESVTGGRRMAEVMTATETALAALVTATGRPKAGEHYAAAIEERDRLAADAQRLSDEVMKLRTALDARAEAEKKLAELTRADDQQARTAEIKAAQAALDGARTQNETLRAAEAELKLLQSQRDAAHRAHGEFALALKKASDLALEWAAAQSDLATAQMRRDAAADEAAKALRNSDHAEQEATEAGAQLKRLDAALLARQAAERLSESEQKLAQAEIHSAEVDEYRGKLALLHLPEQDVSDLEATDIEIAKLTAAAEATRPSVSMIYAPQAPAISLNGEEMEDGRPRTFAGQAQLSIPGIGVLTLRANSLAGSEDKLRQAKEKRRALLKALGVDNLASARQRQQEARQLQSDMRESQAWLSQLAPDGLSALREALAKQKALAGDALEIKLDPAHVKAQYDAAEARRVEARQLWRLAQPQQASAAAAFMEAKRAEAQLSATLMQLDAFLGPVETRAERQNGLATALADTERRLALQTALVEQARARVADIAVLEAKLKRLRSAADAVNTEIGRLQVESAALDAEITTRAGDAVEEKWRECVDALGAATARVRAYEREVAVLTRLRSALEVARSKARDTYLRPVMNELRPLLQLLFDDVGITFDEKTLLPQKILRNGQEEEVERLSGGMREQLSVLTRLAFARLLAGRGQPTPVILDDALVYSDDDRIEKMFDALHRQASGQQIIVFSCRQRAFQRLGGTVLRMMPWTPAQQD